jgi:hypothetical protein
LEGEKDIPIRSDGGEVLCLEKREQGFIYECGAGERGGSKVGGDVVDEFGREFVQVG